MQYAYIQHQTMGRDCEEAAIVLKTVSKLLKHVQLQTVFSLGNGSNTSDPIWYATDQYVKL